jgi:hypothetical protein
MRKTSEFAISLAGVAIFVELETVETPVKSLYPLLYFRNLKRNAFWVLSGPAMTYAVPRKMGCLPNKRQMAP